MKTSIRFDSAINKLYTAFHNNTLNPEDCKQCAVGNILDNKDSWKHLTDRHGSVKLNYVGLVHQNLGRKFNGYSPMELLQIEAVFLRGCGYTGFEIGRCHKPNYAISKDVLFTGLCKVISKMCEFDGLDNVLSYAQLFKFTEYKEPESRVTNY